MIEDFKSQLLELGLKAGDVVLMHSSMKALKTNKSPIEFINDIISFLGSEGTLLIPGFSFESVNAENPIFKAKETEPCVGLIPRTFFRIPGVTRSLHPTHSVCAFGKRAKELTSGHILDETPVGLYSPIMQMLDYNGKILFVGNILHACTFMHGVEEIVGAPYTLAKERVHYIIEDENGQVIEKDMIPHAFHGWRQEYQRIKGILDYPDIKTGEVGQAKCYLIDASALLAKAKEKFNENMFYFVTGICE